MKEKEILDRETGGNGITVDQPKVYDDSLLQQMLNAAESRLASLQILDQAGIASKLGSITGATQSINSFGLSVQGSPLPQIATTNNGATGSTVATNQNATTTSAAPSTSTTNTVQTTNGLPVTNVVTTSPQISAPSVTAPSPSTSLPSSFSVSASDLLSEQMQLTYEIANLRLLLEGSLSDRMLTNGTTRVVKPRVTLGFPITIEPSKRYKDAVAVVEVEIEKEPCSDPKHCDDLSLDKKDPPSIVALLPREKTYNVASITDNSAAISAGVVTQVAAISGSFLHARKTYYVVQDQDTLALTFQPKDSRRVGFLWQFRPVLGAKYVKAGLKQTFVQLSFPMDWSAKSFGAVHVCTYWRSYDRGKSLVRRIVPDSLVNYSSQVWPIDNIPLTQEPKSFPVTALEDLGGGQMLVTLTGRFLGGTYVRVGSSILRDGSPAFSSEYQQIRFVAPIADLATKKTKLVARDGSEKSIEFTTAQLGTVTPLKIVKPTISPIDDANVRLSLTLDKVDDVYKNLPLILLIGGRVFGYSDSPIERDGNTLSVIVSTAFLVANPRVVVTALFMAKDAGYAEWQLPEFTPGAIQPKLSVLDVNADSAKFLLIGSHLDKATVAVPESVKLEVSGIPQSDNLRTLTLNKNQTKNQKQILIQMADGLLFWTAIPTVEFPDPAKINIKPARPITVGMDEVVFLGSGLEALEKVVFNGAELEIRKQADGKAVRVKGLKGAGATAEAKAQNLEFYLKSGKTVVSITVVAVPPR